MAGPGRRTLYKPEPPSSARELSATRRHQSRGHRRPGGSTRCCRRTHAPCRRLSGSASFGRNSKTGGGNAGKAGNPQSFGNSGLFDDGAIRRKLAETGGNTLQGVFPGNCQRIGDLIQRARARRISGRLSVHGLRKLRKLLSAAFAAPLTAARSWRSSRSPPTWRARSRSCAAHCSRSSLCGVSANSSTSRLWIVGREDRLVDQRVQPLLDLSRHRLGHGDGEEAGADEAGEGLGQGRHVGIERAALGQRDRERPRLVRPRPGRAPR